MFSLDGVDCYLARTPDSAPEGTEYVDVGGIRAVRPMEVAFAAITAVQLHRWYGARQYCGRCGHKTKPSPRSAPPSSWPSLMGISCC